MWEKSVPSVTIKLYPLTVVGVILFSSLTLGSWGLWWFQVYPPGWRASSPTADELESFTVPDPLASPSDPLVWSPSVLASPSAVPSLSPTIEGTSTVAETTPVIPAIAVLRVGNQTPHPVRIALLQRGKGVEQNPPSTDAAPVTPPPELPLTHAATDPVHWDFEPGEGGYQGLILSLPQGDLQLAMGDILVAFAQDGSRRYWGPYVIGDTSLPYWSEERSEWQLLIQPY